jgi:hypothetical protein
MAAVLGPRGLGVAHEIADGLVSVNGVTAHAREFTWAALGIHGTVLTADEPPDSPRVRAAAGPGNALAYHAAYVPGAGLRACCHFAAAARGVGRGDPTGATNSPAPRRRGRRLASSNQIDPLWVAALQTHSSTPRIRSGGYLRTGRGLAAD